MKMLAVALLLTAFEANSQCDFNPTITGNVVACDETQDITLETQTYDAYQWYRREWYWNPSVPNPNTWIAVPGATNQSLIVNAGENILHEFKVAVTLGGCTEESPLELIDGFAYGLPVMITTFEPGTFEQIAPLEYNVCSGAVVKFEQGYPETYGLHTWYRCIPSAIPPDPADTCIMNGLTGDSIEATTNGTYGFYSCTEYCPNRCEYLGTSNFITLHFGNFSFCSLGNDDPGNDETGLTLYPNPTIQFIHLRKIPNIQKMDISIIDASGKMVMQVKEYDFEIPINVSELSTGTYLIIGKYADKVVKNRFIKN